MTKKNYFFILWMLVSLDSFVFIIERAILLWSTLGYFPHGELVSMGTGLATIVVNSIALCIGVYCAKRIGMRFLFLQENYDVLNDVLKPAVVIAGLYSVVVLFIHGWRPISSVAYLSIPTPGVSSGMYFFKTILLLLRFDLFVLLFCICGLAFIIRKIMARVQLSTIMPISIIVSCLLIHLFLLFNPQAHIVVDALYSVVTCVLLGMLFWKKNLEAALLCHVIIITLLYLFGPMVVSAVVSY